MPDGKKGKKIASTCLHPFSRTPRIPNSPSWIILASLDSFSIIARIKRSCHAKIMVVEETNSIIPSNIQLCYHIHGDDDAHVGSLFFGNHANLDLHGPFFDGDKSGGHLAFSRASTRGKPDFGARCLVSSSAPGLPQSVAAI
ncbi:hypothetical protein [Brevibacillus sp. SAFN-007a]|uniref:hypothetical protein n=1 Tax=Brevibacillus sp. SAFN-007a TaxID=3436862 RepID=UPI003F816D21